MVFQGFFGNPLNSVEPLLKDVIGLGLEIELSPLPQSISGISTDIPIIAAQRFYRGSIGLSIQLVNQGIIQNRTSFGGFHFGGGDPANDINQETLVSVVRFQLCNHAMGF